MGIIRNLPIVWDELKGDDSLRKMAGMIFQHMQGKERHRLKADITQREAGQWATMLVTASNDSLSDYLNDLAKGNEAGSYRLFELAASNAHVGIVSTAEAATSKSAVNENYGVAGLLYAQFLGTRFEMVRKIVLTTMEKFQKEANTNEAERFWLCTPVCLYLGAQFANMLGLTNIDVPALKDALLAQTDSMRTVMAETPKTISANIGELLCAYLSEHHKKTIWTNDIWNNPNRPIRGMIKVNHPMKMEVMDGPVVQIGEKTNTLRISSLSLYDWLDRRKISRTQFSAALKIMLGADLIRNKSIGSGVAGVASVPTSVFDIDCVKASAALGPMFVQAIDPTSNVIQGNFGKQP
jgi:hypothetical protein